MGNISDEADKIIKLEKNKEVTGVVSVFGEFNHNYVMGVDPYKESGEGSIGITFKNDTKGCVTVQNIMRQFKQKQEEEG